MTTYEEGFNDYKWDELNENGVRDGWKILGEDVNGKRLELTEEDIIRIGEIDAEYKEVYKVERNSGTYAYKEKVSRLSMGEEYTVEDLDKFKEYEITGGYGTYKVWDLDNIDLGDSEDVSYKEEVKEHELLGYVHLNGKLRNVYRDYY